MKPSKGKKAFGPFDEALLAAGRSASVIDVGAALGGGANVDALGGDGRGAAWLAMASTEGDGSCLVLLEMLSRAGGNLDMVDEDRQSPLMEAAERGKETCALFLWAWGARLDRQTSHGDDMVDLANRGGLSRGTREAWEGALSSKNEEAAIEAVAARGSERSRKGPRV